MLERSLPGRHEDADGEPLAHVGERRSTRRGAGSASRSGAKQVAKNRRPATNIGRSRRMRSITRPPSSVPTEKPVRITPHENAPPRSLLGDDRPDHLERRDDDHQEQERVQRGRARASGAGAPRRSRRAARARKRVAAGARGRARAAEPPQAGGADEERAGVERDGAARRDEAHEDAAERRADAEGEAARDAEQRVGLLQAALRRDLRHERGRGGHEERLRGRIEAVEHDEVPDRACAAQEQHRRRPPG